jgi:hypothetical protein
VDPDNAVDTLLNEFVSTEHRPAQKIQLSVCARVRGVLSQDHKAALAQRLSSDVCVHFQSDGQSIKLLQDPFHFKSFRVDHTFGASSEQQEVYHTALRPLVRDVLAGYNGTCMVYGQTASGKTYTMFGSDSSLGIAHFALSDLFDEAVRREEEGLLAKIFVSFYQIYLENIYDLLGDNGMRFDRNNNNNGNNNSNNNYNNGCGLASHWNQSSASLALDMKQQHTLPSLNIREDANHTTFVENLKYVYAHDKGTAIALIEQGLQRRRVNSTTYNIASSRSHAVLQIHCEFEETPPTAVDESSIATSKHGLQGDNTKYLVRRRTLTLVDLAGSERVQTFRQSNKKQLQEAAVINKSIAALGNCIYALSKEASGERDVTGGGHVPYRDCKLTRLLADALGGNAKTSIIATISPCSYNYEETCSTLKFAARYLLFVYYICTYCLLTA